MSLFSLFIIMYFIPDSTRSHFSCSPRSHFYSLIRPYLKKVFQNMQLTFTFPFFLFHTLCVTRKHMYVKYDNLQQCFASCCFSGQERSAFALCYASCCFFFCVYSMHCFRVLMVSIQKCIFVFFKSFLVHRFCSIVE